MVKLSDRKIRWIVRLTWRDVSSRETVRIYGVTVRRIQQVIKKYKEMQKRLKSGRILTMHSFAKHLLNRSWVYSSLSPIILLKEVIPMPSYKRKKYPYSTTVI